MACKIYIAASSAERERAERWIEHLRKVPGFFVTAHWLDIIKIEQDGIANPVDASREDREEWAQQNLSDIRRAGVFWLLIPVETSFGAAFEAGYAYGRGLAVISSGSTLERKKSVFTALGKEFTDDRDAYAYICTQAGIEGPPLP